MILRPYDVNCMIIAAKCHEGVIIGYDSSLSTESMISNRETKKIFKLSNDIIMCCVSGEADFQYLFRHIHNDLYQHSINNRNALSIDSVSKYCRKLINSKFHRAHCIIVGKTSRHEFKIFEIVKVNEMILTYQYIYLSAIIRVERLLNTIILWRVAQAVNAFCH